MSAYVVMAPPEFEDLTGDPRQVDRLVFVPDGFSFLALAFSVLWLIVQRMWLVLLGYLALILVLEAVAPAIGGPTTAIAALTVSLIFGFEARALRRWSLEREGWRVLGTAEGTDKEEAEIRFFHSLAVPKDPAKKSSDQRPGTPAPKPIIPRVGGVGAQGLTFGPETRR